MRRSAGHDFLDPMILKILKESKIPMSTLGINYRINEAVGKTINLNIVRNHLIFLLNNKKISEKIDEEKGVTYYKLV
jgi:repressor of nif and glnA expression